MVVLGFDEALEQVIELTIEEQTQLKVCGPVGLVILKLIAWCERDRSKRKNDASDLSFVLKNYEKLKSVKDAIYGDITLLEKYDADTQKIGAYLLGLDVAGSCKQATSAYLLALMSDDHSIETLATEMSQRNHQDFDDNAALLQAFIDGFKYACNLFRNSVAKTILKNQIRQQWPGTIMGQWLSSFKGTEIGGIAVETIVDV